MQVKFDTLRDMVDAINEAAMELAPNPHYSKQVNSMLKFVLGNMSDEEREATMLEFFMHTVQTFMAGERTQTVWNELRDLEAKVGKAKEAMNTAETESELQEVATLVSQCYGLIKDMKGDFGQLCQHLPDQEPDFDDGWEEDDKSFEIPARLNLKSYPKKDDPLAPRKLKLNVPPESKGDCVNCPDIGMCLDRSKCTPEEKKALGRW